MSEKVSGFFPGFFPGPWALSGFIGIGSGKWVLAVGRNFALMTGSSLSMNPTLSRRTFIRATGASTLGCAVFGFTPPVEGGSSLGNRLGRSRPEALGVNPGGILDFLRAVESSPIRLHSLMVLKRGHVVAEGWWMPYAPMWRHTLYSLSKSFTSTAVGLAVAEGRFGLEDRVTTFFPDDLPGSIGPNLAAMRVKDLLMMGAGHAGDSLFGKEFTVKEANWTRSVLARPVEYFPGTHFSYNNGATYLCSAILQQTTGQTVLEFLTPRLFKPLGIVGADWELNPRGINPGAWGLRVRTEDIAKLGQLYLQRGMWQGKRVLSEAWVEEATRAQIQNASNPDPAKNETNDWAQGYGYQFWRCRHGAYRGDGAYGQYCIVMPKQEAVIAITSETPDMQAVLNEVWTHLLPALDGNFAGGAGSQGAELRRKLAGLALAHPIGKTTSPVAEGWNHTTARFATNALGMESVSFWFRGNHLRVTLKDGKGAHEIEAGWQSWRSGQSRLPVQGLHLALAAEPGVLAVSSRAAWTDDRTLTLRMQFVETAHHQSLIFRFEGNQVRLEFKRSLSDVFPGDKDPRPALTATREV